VSDNEIGWTLIAVGFLWALDAARVAQAVGAFTTLRLHCCA